ncbi:MULTISPECIES: RsmB/NOP family class I SAM-dependent RNA methyltransferase [Halomicrobium]|uniref:RNA methylase, NOL1/NOP2/sun family n=2 Tax=Halomicrobium mukohataei TaxID=57705 RepID=C7P0E3_HALMD|nr:MULTISPECIES: RsmB/NOP family class I SAM-dependent RNA methyltransferase [Halomicrobium]ACV48935.1 RNA methylase, NOL1/NOP2/sun family [Halomicrobium mukohataei DSM 12286]QCD64359.1 RsmB/NOP family class I SAM-dependent RNA methyltransferase [Halomicrobium mukohataei]QFR19165.1 SAM-dependent methyltransferase [Halomicrobium sp. ZPS1]
MDVLERYEPLIDDFSAFRDACARPLPPVVRVNTLKTTVDRAIRALRDEGITVERTDWHEGLLELPDDQPGANWPYFHGWIYGQEEVSAVPVRVLGPEPGERIWDACAAPGSKTSQIAARQGDDGVVVATDSNLGRLSALRTNTEQLGITSVAVTHEDARNHSLKPFGDDDSAEYDRALVDVPCSCEGTVRKNPDTLDEWTLEHVEGIAGVQKGVLRRAIQTTKPGGTVVYSTCTFAPEENEAVLDYALETEACRLVPFEIPLASTGGVTEWQGESYDDSVRQAHRIYPHHNDTGGFFCAKLEVTA